MSAPYLERGIPDARAKFYGMIANFDENLGRLFQRLDELDLADNTIVLFTSDHGTAAGFDTATGEGFNAGMRGAKGSVYEGGHRVSFFMRWPGELPAERRISQPTAHIDVLPTLLDLCGIRAENAADLDGISLAPLLRGERDDLPERAIVIQLQPDVPQKWHHTALIKGRWRLLNGDELYDVESDPGQTRDIAAESRPIVAAACARTTIAGGGICRMPSRKPWQFPLAANKRTRRCCRLATGIRRTGECPGNRSGLTTQISTPRDYWMIDVLATDGKYRIELRTHPREADLPMGVIAASLRIGDNEYSQPCLETDIATAFDVELSAGVTTLTTLLLDAAGQRERGAYYVYVCKS